MSFEKLSLLEGDVSELSDGIKSLTGSSAATLRHMDDLISSQQSKSFIPRPSRVKSRWLIWFTDEYLLTVYDWLCPLAGDFERKQLETFNIAERQDRMAHWFTGTDDFRKWLDEVGKTLWCTGMRTFCILSLSVLLFSFPKQTLGEELLS